MDFPNSLPLSLSLSLSLSFAIRLWQPSLPADFEDHILCPYIAVVDKFSLVVQHLHVHVKASIGGRHLSVRPNFFSSVPHVLFVIFWWL